MLCMTQLKNTVSGVYPNLNIFNLKKHNTSLSIEIIAGITTFLTMAYIMVVFPSILGGIGLDSKALFTATCLVAAIGSILMGFIANYPIALAPSMSLVGYFAFSLILKDKIPYAEALSIVFIAGLLFLLLSLSGWREKIINAIPACIKVGIASGVGLFLAAIALKNINIFDLTSHLVFAQHIVFNAQMALCILGVVLMAILDRYRVLGAIMLGIIIVTVIGIYLHKTPFLGIYSLPPSIAPVFASLQLPHEISIKLIVAVFTFLFVAFFDNTGTLIVVLHQEKKITRVKQAFIADSIATMTGAFFGTSSVGSFIESAAGVRAGGRTGLTAVVVGILFLSALFFQPLAATIPAYATAAALLYVAFLMQRPLRHLHWHESREWLPAVLTALVIPFTFSIADGVIVGILAYLLLSVFKK